MSKKVIIVTGAASGLGAAIADNINKIGYQVIRWDKKYHVGMDLSNCDEMLEQVVVDIKANIIGLEIAGIINCAGVNAQQKFEDVDFHAGKAFEVMEVNAFAPIRLSQLFLDDLSKSKGFILNIVSNAAHMPMTYSLAYNMSKAALLIATKQMHRELFATHGITAFSVSPNKLFGTEMSKQIDEEACRTRGWTMEQARQYQLNGLPCKRETDPEAVANFICNIIHEGHWQYLGGTDVPFGGPTA